MSWSTYQQAIFDFVANEQGSAIVEAVAGSGKTTTIVEALKHVPAGQRAGFVAFNKSIAQELGQRVPQGVDCKTLNGLGHGAVMKGIGKVQLDTQKTNKLAKEVVPEEHREVALAPVKQLVSAAKASGLDALYAGTEERWAALGEQFGIELPQYSEKDGTRLPVLQWASEVLELGVQRLATIDFDDQLYLPVRLSLPTPKYDVLFVDEAQDVSHIQRALVAQALKRGGRLIAVGDSRQAIYGFRGADSRSLANIQEQFAAVRLPLTVTYRCPRRVVELAQRYAPELQACEGAPQGTVDSVKQQALYDRVQEGDLILCRNNAPLLRLAYSLIAARVPCHVQGRDIGQGLVNLIKRLRRAKVGDMLAALDEWEASALQQAKDQENQARMDQIEDQAASIRTVAEMVNPEDPVGKLIEEIETLFGEQKGVTLSSVHRAKGLEAERVYILEPERMPSPRAKKDWELEQEENLIYVAYTRATKELWFVT